MELKITNQETIYAFATKGTGSNEEDRLRTLLEKLDAHFLAYEKSNKLKSLSRLLRELSRTRRKLIVMEGTGIAGGLACLIASVLWGHRYVFSSGDAVGPFVGAHVWGLGVPFGIYERLLCRMSSGFIGWTPYLLGRALTFGAPRGVTAPGWVLGANVTNPQESRRATRQRWGIDDDRIVFGIAGSLIWNKRRKYCYGLELVRAIRKSSRKDVAAVIIGDGSGVGKLRAEAGEDLGRRIFLPGPVPLNSVMENLRGFDVASLPQSTDAVGAFRFTTKISEYLGAALPIVTLRIPAAYDLDITKCWRLPGTSPWDPVFINALACLMDTLETTDIQLARSDGDVDSDAIFDREKQVIRVTRFLQDLLEEC